MSDVTGIFNGGWAWGRGCVHRGCYLILAFLCQGIVKAFNVTAGILIQQLLSTFSFVSSCRFGP